MRILASVVLVLALGCGGESPTAPTAASIAGTWSLSTVNGSPLPFTIVQVGADKFEITGDVIVAIASGSFTQVSTFKSTEGGQVENSSVADAGTFTVNGTAVVFTFNSDGSSGTGSLSGNTFTIAQSGFVSVYVKQ